MTARRLMARVAAGGLVISGVGVGAVTAAVPPAAAGVTLQLKWSQTLTDGYVNGSSPMVATLDSGGPSVVVGTLGGHIYAFHLSNGSSVAGWPAATGGVPVDSTPSVYGSNIYVGLGNASNPNQGGYAAYGAHGQPLWYRSIPSLPGGSTPSAVEASLALGNLQGQADVVAGSMGQMEDALNAANGSVLSGYPWLQADTNISTPALANLFGQTDIIQGGASTAGDAGAYVNGGHLRIASNTGRQLCNYNTNQEVDSSPAIGQIFSGGATGIAVGTGRYWPGASQTNQLLAFDTHCHLHWATTLDGYTQASPALVDALGNGQLQVAQGTYTQSPTNFGGSVWLLNGATGQPIWVDRNLGAVQGGVASVDLGGGYQDIVVAARNGLKILDGKTGAVLASGVSGYGAVNVPLVTDDPNGTVGITFAGFNNRAQGMVLHYEVANSSGSRVSEKGAWPMFHHDPHLTGSAGVPPPVVAAPCKAPTTTPSGYWLTSADGGTFNYGNLPFCGSTGNVILNRPIVGLAGTPNAGGYWLVASDGGIFAFGNAHFYGSTGGITLNKPVVGMATTPDGRGYWLVASDGGIFSYGDAHFYGSTGNITLAKPVVGMAPGPSGHGYWFVASDGGIFGYGDAHFYGSAGGTPLSSPVVKMAPGPKSLGYWLATANGGVLHYGTSRYLGSPRAVASPLVGIVGY